MRVPLLGLTEGPTELADDEARYVRNVHRLGTGESFVAFDPEQALQAQATIVSVQRGRVRCVVSGIKPADGVPKVALWLMLGVCKGDRFEWALREATALGVTDIVPTWCVRSASSGSRIDAVRAARWKRILVQGARQSGRGNVPVLHDTHRFSEAITVVPVSLVRVCLWERAAEPVWPWLRSGSSGMVLLVGPEGGLEESEVDEVRGAEFAVGSLGQMVLRTETATIVALGAWKAAQGS